MPKITKSTTKRTKKKSTTKRPIHTVTIIGVSAGICIGLIRFGIELLGRSDCNHECVQSIVSQNQSILHFIETVVAVVLVAIFYEYYILSQSHK